MVKITIITSLYNCSKYLKGYFEAVAKIVNKEECEFLLLHNAPTNEELSFIEAEIDGKAWFRHIIIPEREGLYVTWNRGILLSEGEYCAIWNVDDIRFPNSLILQSEALDANTEVGLVTASIYGTDKYGAIGNKIYYHNRFEKNPNEAFRSCLVGCFPMWRKSIHTEIGYFDEQFKCVADFDFQIRVAMKYKLFSIDQPIGVYLENDKNKISSNGLQIFENNVVYLRYGAYEKVQLQHYFKSNKMYNKEELKNFNDSFLITTKKPFTKMYMLKGIILSLILLPINILRDLKNTI